MNIPEGAGPALAALAGLAAALAASILIAATKRWHGRLTLDTHAGPQKVHDQPTPRIGGIALFAGLATATAAAAPPIRELLLAVAVGSAIAFAAGLAEDLAKNVSPSLRLAATVLSGVLFCLVTGYSVTRLDFVLLDEAMALPLVSIAFTVFVIAGLTNALNLIDGFHGLAAGTSTIMLLALGALAFLSGDPEIAWAAVAAAAVLLGFLAVNFPFGHVFLGDGGAYLAGLMPGTLAIMLAARNPEVSVWAVAVVLAYPVLETVFTMARRATRGGGFGTGRPDTLHLHHLVHRRIGAMLARRSGNVRLANPVTGAVMWTGAATGLLFVILIPHTRELALLAIAVLAVVYAAAYRMLAPPPRPGGDRDAEEDPAGGRTEAEEKDPKR